MHTYTSVLLGWLTVEMSWNRTYQRLPQPVCSARARETFLLPPLQATHAPAQTARVYGDGVHGREDREGNAFETEKELLAVR